MPSRFSTAISAARSQRQALVSQALGRMSKGYNMAGIVAGNYNNSELGYGQTLMRHTEQQSHFNGWTYVLIHRIATRLAGQKVKMGRKVTDPSVNSWSWDRTPGKRLPLVDKMRAPTFVKNLDTDIELIEDHPLLTAIQEPNSVMTAWALIYVTVASMMLTGKSYWWFIEGEDGELEIWPLPANWVTPIHANGELNSRYRIQPSGHIGATVIVDGDEVACFYLPDPSNPLGAVSPVQSQAPAVAIDEEIQNSQFRYFKNGIFPGMKITIGRLPSMTGVGEGQRPVLTSEQRREIREAARALWQGSINYNEPLVVDGMIEDIQRISQTGEEMAFIDSATFNKSRLFSALGVNPYIVGEVTGVNKAQAVVAESNFNVNVLSPIAEMIGQKMTAHIGEEGVVFWLELPETSDPDQKLRNWQAVLPYGVVKKSEYRQQILGIPPAGDETDDEYIGQQKAAPDPLAMFGGSFGGQPSKPTEKPGEETPMTPSADTERLADTPERGAPKTDEALAAAGA